MAKKHVYGSVVVAMTLLAACGPYNKEKSSDSSNLQPLTTQQKVDSIRLQQPISVIQQAIALVVDPDAEMGASSADVTDLATLLNSSCEIERLDVTPQRSKKQVDLELAGGAATHVLRINITASDSHLNCPVMATVDRTISREARKRLGATESASFDKQSDQVSLSVRADANNASLTQIKSLKYTAKSETQSRTDTQTSSLIRERIVSSSGVVVVPNDESTLYTTSRDVKVESSNTQVKETQVMQVSLIVEQGTSVWENQKTRTDGGAFVEQNSFNNVVIKQDEFEKLKATPAPTPEPTAVPAPGAPNA